MSRSQRNAAPRAITASQVLERITGDDPALRKAIRQQELNFVVSEMIYDARTTANLSQAQLAKLVGTTQSVISRLEDADYEGHSLTMLQRIAEALHHRLVVRMVPVPARVRRGAPVKRPHSPAA